MSKPYGTSSQNAVAEGLVALREQPEPPPLMQLEPMLLTEAKSPWSDDGMLTEPKMDGYRLLAETDGPVVRLRTRNGADATRWYPELQSLAGLGKRRTVLDGEVCVLDDLGRSDFDRLHARSRRRRWFPGADPVVYVVFDVLVHQGVDVRPLPLASRKALLKRLLAKPRASVMPCGHFPGTQAPQLYEAALQLKLEGIVMKRLDSPYVGGQTRTGDWVKVKPPGATPAQRFDRGDLTLHR